MESDIYQDELFEQIVSEPMPSYHRNPTWSLPAPLLDTLRTLEMNSNSSETITKVVAMRYVRAAKLASEVIQLTGLSDESLSPKDIAKQIDAMREMHDEQYATYDSSEQNE